jgi:ArsR family transcriptional regulator, arsenate/arsenite/antimonite-responsive transcriptional repressor
MEKINAVSALAALAQDSRLDIVRLLAQAGPEGMPAGAVATALDLAPNTLTFHLDRLKAAGLVAVRRDGRSMIYAAQFETMNALIGFLGENCRSGVPSAPAEEAKPEPAPEPQIEPEPKPEPRPARKHVTAWGMR